MFSFYIFDCETQAQRPSLGLCEWDAVEKRTPLDQEETDLDSRIIHNHEPVGESSDLWEPEPLGLRKEPLHGQALTPSP